MAWLSLALGACYGSISAGYDVGAPADGDADVDADIDADIDADSDADGDADGDSEGDVEVDPLIDDVIAAIDRSQELLCLCSWASGGYASVDACVAATATPAEVIRCTQLAYLAHQAEFEGFYRCRRVSEDGLGDCLDRADCVGEEMEACGDAYWAALDRCPVVSDEIDLAFDAIFIPCLAGDPSGCPDATLTAGADHFEGSTVGAGQDLQSAGCGGGPSADVALRWTATVAGVHTFELTEAAFDPLLYVLSACDGEELGCNDDIDREGGNWLSRVEVTLAAGQTVIIVIDGWAAWERGAFELEITGP